MPVYPPIVLIHGAWLGGWCWEKVVAPLKAAGADVHVPTLPGLGSRHDPSLPPPALADHIADVVKFITTANLDEVVLVGHSYAGMVITGVADRLRSRIRRLVYLDAAVPDDGEDFASHVPGRSREEAERMRKAFRAMSVDGLWLDPLPPEDVGIEPGPDSEWVARLQTPHPLRTWLEPVRLSNGGHHGIPKTYVMATDPPTEIMGYPRHGEVAGRGGEWTLRRIAAGHAMLVTMPEHTSEFLLEAADS